MQTLDTIRARRSIKRLVEPAPSAEELQTMLEAAALAPDHKELKPWRFIILRGDAKSAFTKVLVDAVLHRSPDATGGQIDKARKALDRAPLVVVVAAKRLEDVGLPFEELHAAVAAATQNLLLAATELGYGSIWRTGAHSRDANVKGALGLDPADEILGFVYLGTSPGDPIPPRRPTLDGLVSEWHPEKISR